MKKGLALAAIAALIVATGMVTFIPPVRAQAGEIISRWFHIRSPDGKYEVGIGGPMEFTPLSPTYLPAGLQSSGGGISVVVTGGESESTVLSYHSDEQFVAIKQTKALADKALPAGREVTVNGQPAVLATGLEGTFEYGHRIPEGAKTFTLGTPPARAYYGTITYTDGKRLTWYAGDVKVEMLSNLSEKTMLRIAESMTPAGIGESDLRPPDRINVTLEEVEVGEGGVIIREGSSIEKLDHR